MFWSLLFCFFFFFKQKTAYEMRISDWSSDVCSSDLSALDAPAYWDAAVCPYVVILGAAPSASAAGPRFDPARWTHRLGCRPGLDGSHHILKIGRASCRERVCQSV